MLQEEIKEKAKTSEIKSGVVLQEIKEASDATVLRLKLEEDKQDFLDKIKLAEIERERKLKEMETFFLERLSELEIRKTKEQMQSITPGLIEALTSLSTVSLSEILAKNLKIQTGGLGGIFPNGGM